MTKQVSLKNPRSFFIDGQWAAPSTDRTFDVVSPHNEERYMTVAEAADADGAAAIDAARRAFDSGPWPRMSHAERAGYMRRLSEGLKARGVDLANAWINESGVIQAYAQYGHLHGAGLFDYYAGFADSFEWVEKHTPSMGGGQGYLVREPVGVVLAIVPWNAPFGILASKVAPALIAGCTVVLKSSPEAPLDGLIFAEVCEEVGLPAGVVNVLTADRAVSEAMVRNPAVDKVSFTGSTAAGKAIAGIMAQRVGRYTLELGGKSAAIIRDDYDIETAARQLAGDEISMTGQVCASLTRIIVSEERHDALVDAIGAAFSAIKVGDPYDQATQMGPLAMERQLDRVLSYIEKGKAEGARLAAGGGRPAGLNRGYFVEPTVFGNVDNAMAIAREEIFGPVLSVIPVKNEEEAIHVANDTPFGLNSAVFTNDTEAAFAIGRRIRAGTVGHNAFRADFAMGFGGFKESGIGREGGRDGLLPYLEAKTMLLDKDVAR